MPDFRSFAPLAKPGDTEILLSPEESSHLVRVNRAREGDPVVAFDGQGREWHCECAEAHRNAARLRVISEREIPAPPTAILLAQALPKGKNFDLIIRKATELGVAEILPLVTDHSEVRLDEHRKESKHDKWETVAIEAAKQSGNARLPRIAPIQTFAAFLESTANSDLKIIASLQPETQNLRQILETRFAKSGVPREAICLIGPEGDFSETETAAALQSGFAPISLGPTVLRCETAAISALSILAYELRNLPNP